MTLEDLKKKIEKFADLHYIYFKDEGHLVWRFGTGYNIEILDIEAYKKRQGIGTKLIRELVSGLGENPSVSIFGFTKEINDDAKSFYKALGFRLSPVIKDLYRKGGILFIINYKDIRNI